MNELPAGLAGPLHLLEPYPWGRLLAILGIVAFLALATWWWWRRRANAVLDPEPELEPEPPRSGLENAVALLRERYRDAAADYRRACHELAAALRAHLGGRRFASLTVGEIAAREGDGAVARLFRLVAGYQFGRRTPTRDHFDRACELAVAVARQQLGKKP